MADSSNHDPPSNADDLLPFIPIATRAMFGQLEEQGVLDAATQALSRGPCIALILRVRQREAHIASASMGQTMMRAIAAFAEGPQQHAPLTLDNMPTVARICSSDMTLSTTVLSICRELFSHDAAGKVASLIGSAGSACLGAPIRLGSQPWGVLLLVQPRKDSRELAAVSQLAESIGTALAFARVLDAVKRARMALGTDHPAQHYLGSALRSVGHLAPNAPRSLNPDGGVFETLSPNIDNDTFSLRPGAPPDAEPAPSTRARILLVEDEDRVRKSTIALLGGLGYAVEGTGSGERAIALYTTAKDQARGFDLVLMDQTLVGQMGGVETMRILRSLDPEVRAILLSGQADRESPEEMARHGFRATINKPVALEDLNAAIESALA